ncbi:MAG: hypothetical protein IJB53_07910, partial [Mailhella sp.]|nr:hypothetical protein [Mailhella sp.]
MLTKGAIGNLVNRYKAVLKKCNLINTFGSLAVASMLVMGGAGVASAADFSGNKLVWEGNAITYDGNITITHTGNAEAVQFNQFYKGANDSKNAGSISLGSDNSTISITSNREGVSLWDGGDSSTAQQGIINLTGKTIDISVTSTDYAFGVYAGSDESVYSDQNNTINIKSIEGTTIYAKSGGDAEAYGILAHSGAIINVEGPLKVEALRADDSLGVAIEARGMASVNIGQKGETVKLKGNVQFGYASNSGTGIDAKVNIALNGPESYWEGTVQKQWEDGIPNPNKLTVTEMHLAINNGATWIPVIKEDSGDPASDESGIKSTALNNLSMNDGNVQINEGVSVAVEKVSGNGNINMEDAENLGSFTAENAAGAELNVQATDKDGNVKNADG